ncbi:hypothetical protein F5Y03DRAFT_362187 [Xylaria venustula]|nr:hypothetical protein F5Y03DRAFT_362187 [Xylaria venustula]
MAKTNSFKVIIAGGSVVGLTMANALERAGIDYILLEKREIAPNLGASISLLPHNWKVYEQLGMTSCFTEATVPLLNRYHFNQTGDQSDDSGVLRGICAKTNRPFRFIERRVHLQCLYDNLRDKSKVYTQTGLSSFIEDDRGITVFTDNGKEFTGSILVGADGVHSTVRQQISEAIAATDPARAKALQSPFTSSYRAIYAISQNIDVNTQESLMPNGTVYVSYDQGVSGIAATGVEGLVFWFLFVRQDVVTRTPNCPTYSEADVIETIEKHGGLVLGQDNTFRDLWNTKVHATMFPMEEGTVEGPWNNGGRVVLLGDSASKATINAGMGGNTHIEGVCHLTNAIMELLEQSPVPDTREVTRMMNKYEESQRPRAKMTVTLSNFTTRLEAMETWWTRLLIPVMGWLPDGMMSTLLARYFNAGPLFHFLPNPKD